MINSSITSFFDVENGSFWSFVISYTRFVFSQDVYARKANATAQIFSVGSGHDVLAKKIDGEEIERFTAAIAESWSEPELAQWLERCFHNVSAENKSVGDTYDAFIATRADLLFRLLVRSP